MSVRAYKVIEIKTEKGDSFNLWHDEAFCNALGNVLDGQLNFDGCGLVDVSIDDLQEALNTEGVSQDTKDSVQKDIEEAKRQGDEYIQYYCY